MRALLVCLLAGCAGAPRSLPAANGSAAPSAVVSPFAAHAPARTRLLFSMRVAEASSTGAAMSALTPLFDACHFSLYRDVTRVDFALAEPKEFRMDLSGALSVDAVRCLLDTLKQGGALDGIELEAVPVAGGVRIATHGALADGPGAPSSLARRFAELLQDSENAGVTDLAPGGACDVWTDQRSALSLRVALRSPAEATHAAAWLKSALAAEPSGRLAAVDVVAAGPTLSVRTPKPDAEQALLLRQNVLEAFRLPSGSMLPTLLPGDHFFVRKGPTAHAPARGDIVVFTSPRDPSLDFVKRVIGVAGDRVEVAGHAVRINGRALETKLKQKDFELSGAEPLHGELWTESAGDHHYDVFYDASHPAPDALAVRVEPEHVFLLGDNRGNSFDSRHFGSVPVGSIKGQVVVIWASFDEQAVRWERFGSEPE